MSNFLARFEIFNSILQVLLQTVSHTNIISLTYRKPLSRISLRVFCNHLGTEDAVVHRQHVEAVASNYDVTRRGFAGRDLGRQHRLEVVRGEVLN